MNRPLRFWTARLIVGVVFFFNVTCALAFIARPGDYAPAFEVSGLPGEVMVRGMGILFLMWNVPYLPVLVRPERQRTCFAVILVQQAIGVLGETAMWLDLPPGHPALWETGLRFILFDGAGLIGMVLAYGLTVRITPRSRPDPAPPARHGPPTPE